MRSPAQALRDSVSRTAREASALRSSVERALREARDAVARSPYGRLQREPRDPRDPERGSLARVLRRARIGDTADKEREAHAGSPPRLRGG